MFYQVICKCLCDKCVCAFLWAIFALAAVISIALLWFTGALLFKKPKDRKTNNASGKKEEGDGSGTDTNPNN